MANVKEIESIGPVQGDKLEAAGVKSLEALLQTGASPQGRTGLAAKTGIKEDEILKWVDRADLARIKGIGSEFADLLENAGVDSVPELAKRVPANLHLKLVEINEAKKLVRIVPTEKSIADWVDQAKNLDRVVTH